MSKKINKSVTAVEVAAAALIEQPGGEFKRLPLSEIESSPFNYRRLFPLPQLQELAQSIALYDVIENLTVRLLPSGKYQLVAGERRFRAAGMAGLATVPCMIREYSDEQVRQIQLAENLHRENPTLLEEAEGLNALLDIHHSIDVLAKVVGKSKTYIYSRLKLLSLIPAIQEMLIAGKFSLTEAVLIASLATASQEQFFADYCADWTAEDFERPDVEEALDRFTYELSKAQFSLIDATLYPEMGACDTCPFNTATASLFPELAAKAVCTNSKCFDHKNDIQFLNGLRGLVALQVPQALIFYGAPSPYLRRMVEQVSELKDVLTYNYYHVQVVKAPEPPAAEEYYFEGEDGEAPELDAEGFAEAMEEYQSELADYEQAQSDSALLHGLVLTERKFETVVFNPDSQWRNTVVRSETKVPTAKEVQAAIKAGTATIELLSGEKTRIEQRASRQRQLDREKVQQAIYKNITEKLEPSGPAVPLTAKDWPVVWYLIFKALDWSSHSDVEEGLWPSSEEGDNTDEEQDSTYARMQKLSPEQCGWLVRKAVTSKAESKMASSDLGYFLYQMAGSFGIDTEAIEQTQLEKAEARQEKYDARNRDLDKRIARMKARQLREQQQQEEQQQD